MIPQRVSLRDPGVLSDMAGAAGFDVQCDQLEPGRLEGVVEYVATSSAQFFRDRFDRDICNHGSVPPGMVAFTLPTTVRESGIFCGEAMAPGTVGIITVGDEYSYRAPANHGILGSCIATERLERALNERYFISLARVLPRTTNLGIPASAIARLRRAMHLPFELPLAPGLVLDHEALGRAVEDRLVSAVCVALTSGVPSARTRRSVRNHSRSFRAARDYIESHLGETLRMESLCRLSGASERTLETAFCGIVGITPAHFIKKRRLNAARRLLQAADPVETSVKSIALKCGFWHLGRFACDYKTHFGESPSTTLYSKARHGSHVPAVGSAGIAS